MASVLRKSFQHPTNECTYSFEIIFPDASGVNILDRQFSLDIVAEKYDPAGRRTEKIDATITLEHRLPPQDVPHGLFAIIDCKGHEFVIQLSEEWSSDLPFEPNENSPSVDWKAFIDEEDAFANGLEAFLNGVPVPEPALGCVLKAGISSVVGQTIRCNNKWVQTRDEARVSRLRSIKNCLWESAGKLVGKAATRTMICWGTLGTG